MSLLNFFQRQESLEKMVRSIVDDLINLSIEISVRNAAPESIVSEKTLESWSSKYPWLVVKKDGKEIRLVCKTCTVKKTKSIWANEGSVTIQKNSVERHANSDLHKQAETGMIKLCQKQCNVITPACETLTADEEFGSVHVTVDDVKLFRTIYHAAKEEIPSNKVNCLLELQNLNGANIKYMNLSHGTVSEIQECITTMFERSLVEEIKESEYFAVMIDESTDLSVQKHLSVCVRFVKNGEAITKFLGNMSVADGKAHTIVQALVTCLHDHGLDPTKIVSLATDGAATMMGKKTGVGVQLKSKYSPFLVQSHCIAHRLNLAIVDSIKKIDILKKLKDNFNSLYFFMSGSANRTAKLKSIQQLFEEPELTIKEPNNIRWLSLRNAVEAVYCCYSSLLATLSCLADENMSTAQGLLKYYSQYKTVLLTAFILDVHDVLGVLSKQLQKRNLLFSEIRPLMEGTVSKLEFLENQFGQSECKMRDQIEIRAEEDGTSAYINGEKLTKYSDRIESQLLGLKKEYIFSLKKNIRHRFRSEDSEIFRDFSLLLEPSVVNTSCNDDITSALEALGTFYSEKEVKIVHGNIYDARQETRTVNQLIDKEKMKQEWPVLKGMISGSYKNLNTQSLCARVMQLHVDMIPELKKLCTIALCFSVTSVECERSFSAQNRIKTKSRCSLTTQNLNNLLHMQLSNVSVSDYNPHKAIRLWLTKKKRRGGRLCQPFKPRDKSDPCSSKVTC